LYIIAVIITLEPAKRAMTVEERGLDFAGAIEVLASSLIRR